MKRKKHAHPGQKATFDGLSKIFPALGPVVKIFEEDTDSYSRVGAIGGIIKQALKLLVTIFLFGLLIFIGMKFESHIPESAISVLIQPLLALIFGAPLLITVIVTTSNAFDLLYLFLTGNNFEKGGGELKPLKTLMLVLISVGCLTSAVLGLSYHSQFKRDKRDQVELKQNESELIRCLNKSSSAWNEFYTENANVNASFCGTDLSNRTFKRYFLRGIDFSQANLDGTVFENCNLSHANFVGASCKKTSFNKSFFFKTDFKGTDLTKAQFSNCFADAKSFDKAKISPSKLKGLIDYKKSPWYGVKWFDFHDDKWLNEKGYYTDGRSSRGLRY